MFLFTGYMTLTFVKTVIPNAPLLVVMATLLVFDGGMLAWLVVFTSYAQGTTQRATAIVTCLFDFGGVGLMVAAEIVTAQSNVVTDLPLASWATWAVALWTFANVGAILLFHLSDPETRKEMSRQARQDRLLELAGAMLENDLDDEAVELAQQIKQRDKMELYAALNLNKPEPAPMLSANAPMIEAPIYTADQTQPLTPIKPQIVAAEVATPAPVISSPAQEAGENFQQANLTL